MFDHTKSDTHTMCAFCIVTVIVFGVLVVWMINFYTRYCLSSPAIEIQMRRPLFMLFSYLLILPWFLEELWSTFVLYFSGNSHPMQWTYDEDGSMPTIYEPLTNLKLHFAFWFCFWCFLHSKLFRLWMIRYDFEYDKEMRNIEWKGNLGLRSIKRNSIIIRYRKVLGNKALMICLQLLVVIINTCLHVLVRLVPILPDVRYTQYYEHSIILSLSIIELSLFLIVMQKEPMRAINDVHYVRLEWILFVKMCIVLLSAYLTCLALWFTTNIYLNVALVRCAGQMLLNLTLFLFGYLDFVWIMRKINKNNNNNNNKNKFRCININNNFQSSQKCGVTPLLDILECQDGFESMMRFLVGESLCPNLLCYVECTQFVHEWAPSAPKDCASLNKHLYLPLIWGYIRQHSVTQFQLYVPDDITLLVLSYYKKLYVSLDVRHSMAKQFLFFEHLTFDTDAANYRYLIQKYVADTAPLKVLVSDPLRHKMVNVTQRPLLPDTVTPFLIDLVNGVREELWNVTLHSFVKFKETNDYKALANEIESQKETHTAYKDLEYSIHLRPIPKVTEIEGDSTVIDIQTA